MLKVIYCLNVLVAVGGVQGVSNTDNENFKEVFKIEIDGVQKCLGAFAVAKKQSDPRFIVTAAHCVYGVQASRLEVKLGETRSKSVERVRVHPYYLPPSPDYDIALLKINKEVIPSGQTGLLLNRVVLRPGDNLVAFNWNVSEIIKATLEDRKSCRANHVVVSPRMLCANTDTVVDGSPLIKVDSNKNNQDRTIVGVGSYQVGGGSQKLKIFTNIANSEIYSFIETYID